jgi:hypothetical protein
MDDKKNAILPILAALPLSVLYFVWILVTAIFGLAVYLLVALFPSRSAHHAGRYGASVPSRIGVVAADVLAVVLAYTAADLLRCTFWQHCSWPEVDVNYGSTLKVHLRMLLFVPVAWPLILYWLGWYRPRWRSWQWKVLRTVAAAVLLGLAMAGFSLLVDRLIYPRVQIGFVVVVLPVATLVVRGVLNRVGRLLGIRSVTPASRDVC